MSIVLQQKISFFSTLSGQVRVEATQFLMIIVEAVRGCQLKRVDEICADIYLSDLIELFDFLLAIRVICIIAHWIMIWAISY